MSLTLVTQSLCVIWSISITHAFCITYAKFRAKTLITLLNDKVFNSEEYLNMTSLGSLHSQNDSTVSNISLEPLKMENILKSSCFFLSKKIFVRISASRFTLDSR